MIEIARETAELAGKARDGKLALAEMQGGTFTISSIGGIGGTAFTQIVNAPEVAILGATRAATKPVWDGKEFVPRLMLPISVSYDHRVIDGAGAARFLVLHRGAAGRLPPRHALAAKRPKPSLPPVNIRTRSRSGSINCPPVGTAAALHRPGKCNKRGGNRGADHRYRDDFHRGTSSGLV